VDKSFITPLNFTTILYLHDGNHNGVVRIVHFLSAQIIEQSGKLDVISTWFWCVCMLE